MVNRNITLKNIKTALQGAREHRTKLKDGLTTIIFESKTPDRNSPVYLEMYDGERIPAPEGKIELVNGKYVIVDQNNHLVGIYKSKKDADMILRVSRAANKNK